MMKNTSRGPKTLFDLDDFSNYVSEFELKDFSCKGLLVNSEGTEKFVRFRRSFELQKFELHEFNYNSSDLFLTSLCFYWKQFPFK